MTRSASGTSRSGDSRRDLCNIAMAIKPPYPMTLSKISIQTGMSEHLYQKEIPRCDIGSRRGMSLRIRASRVEIGIANLLDLPVALGGECCQRPRKMKTPPASDDTGGVSMLSPLARLLHLNGQLPGGEAVP